MQTITSGRIITASIFSIKKFNFYEIWQIMSPDKVIAGAKWVPELALGWDLFNHYRHSWKEKPPGEWWPLYVRATRPKTILSLRHYPDRIIGLFVYSGSLHG